VKSRSRATTIVPTPALQIKFVIATEASERERSGWTFCVRALSISQNPHRKQYDHKAPLKWGREARLQKAEEKAPEAQVFVEERRFSAA
jgi:hypothetical protein